MKKIFTLLFCVAAFSFATSANTNVELVEQCINVLLNNNGPSRIQATEVNPVFDANHDGVITIADVTTLIDQGLEQEMANHAPSQKMDVDAIIDEILTSDKPKANIGDVNKAIEHNLKQE